MSVTREQRALYERQSEDRGDMEQHYRWFAPRLRLDESVRFAADRAAERVLEVGCGDGVLLAAVLDALPAPPPMRCRCADRASIS